MLTASPPVVRRRKEKSSQPRPLPEALKQTPRPSDGSAIVSTSWADDSMDFERAIDAVDAQSLQQQRNHTNQCLTLKKAHALHTPWTLWVDSWVTQNKSLPAVLQRRCIASFISIEGMWRYFNNTPPNAFPKDATLQLFRSGELPDWESHPQGGQFKVYPRANTVSRPSDVSVWEDLILLMVGESLPCSEAVLGAGVCCRERDIPIIKVWLRDADNFHHVRTLHAFLFSLHPDYECVFKPNAILLTDSFSLPQTPVTDSTSPPTERGRNGWSNGLKQVLTSADSLGGTSPFQPPETSPTAARCRKGQDGYGSNDALLTPGHQRQRSSPLPPTRGASPQKPRSSSNERLGEYPKLKNDVEDKKPKRKGKKKSDEDVPTKAQLARVVSVPSRKMSPTPLKKRIDLTNLSDARVSILKTLRTRALFAQFLALTSLLFVFYLIYFEYSVGFSVKKPGPFFMFE